MELIFQAVAEDKPGDKWQALFARHWPAYEHWFLSEGIAARATYDTCLTKLRQHMPELEPTYEKLCELAGGGDIAARFLSLYKPPAYLTGCSQVVWPGDEPMLVRNYDYSPALCEGLIQLSRWNGRQVVGDGFGIPLVLRYILEFCETVEQAGAVLKRVPVHMAYNVTAADRSGKFITAFVAPGEATRLRPLAVATNHQGRIDWHNYARATATVERERFLQFRLQDADMTPERLIASFQRSPLYTTAYGQGFGTLYTAVYWPGRRAARYLWPDGAWEQSIEAFQEGVRHQRFDSAVDLSAAKG